MSIDDSFDTSSGGTQPPGATYFAELVKDSKATPNHEIEDLLITLQSNKGAWVQLEISERLLLLDQVRIDLLAVKDAWIQSELKAKDIPAKSVGVAEEWVILAQLFRAIQQIQLSLMDIQTQGQPAIPGSITSGPGGRVVVRTFPQTIWDRFIFRGVTGDVWMKPGITSTDVVEDQAARY